MIEQVRGKGSNKTKTIFGEDDEEETHVLITGPSEEAVMIAKRLAARRVHSAPTCAQAKRPKQSARVERLGTPRPTDGRCAPARQLRCRSRANRTQPALLGVPRGGWRGRQPGGGACPTC